MAKSSTYSNSVLLLLFNGTSITGVAENISSSPLTNLYVALHTADPTSAGNQTANEVTYTGYARVAVARTSSGWVVTGNSVSPVSTISFPAGTGGSGTALFWSVGPASSGSSEIFYCGSTTTITLGSGITPELSSGSTFTEN